MDICVNQNLENMYLTATILVLVTFSLFVNVEKLDPIKVRVKSNNDKKFFKN